MRVTSKSRGAVKAQARRVEQQARTSSQRLADKAFTTFMHEHNATLTEKG